MSADGVVEVKNSYAVPHNEANGQVFVDVEFHRAMIELHQRVNPKELVVGWYSTGEEVVPTDALIHEFYNRECAVPVHVALGVGLSDRSRLIRAWTGNPLNLGAPSEDKAPVAIHFQEVTVDSQFAEAERVGLELLRSPSTNAIRGEMAGLEATVTKLSQQLEAALQYVEDVCAKKTLPDVDVGRKLSAALAAVPQLTRTQFEKLFGESIQDVLMVMYLSSVTKLQLGLAEKLGTASMLV